MVKTKLIARIYIDFGTRHFQSEYAHVGVNFNFILDDSSEFDINFASDYEIPKSKVGMDKIQVDGQLHYEPIGSMTALTPYGYQIQSSEKNMNIEKAERFVRHGRSIRRKLNKMTDEQGYEADMKDYLVRLFAAMSVDAVIFETKSEADGNSRWKQYSVDSTGDLIEEAIAMIAAERGWNFAEAI